MGPFRVVIGGNVAVHREVRDQRVEIAASVDMFIPKLEVELVPTFRVVVPDENWKVGVIVSLGGRLCVAANARNVCQSLTVQCVNPGTGADCVVNML